MKLKKNVYYNILQKLKFQLPIFEKIKYLNSPTMLINDKSNNLNNKLNY
jgi:hypothetical protein